MKLLQNRIVAVLIAAAVVFGSTLANVNRSLNRLNRDYEKALSSVVGNAEAAAQSCAKNTALLLSVLNGAPSMEQGCAELREAADSMSALTDPAALSEAAGDLLRLAEKLEDEFEALPGTAERDEENAEYYTELLEESCELLTESGLPEALQDCREGWSSPVVRVLKPLLRAERPDGV